MSKKAEIFLYCGDSDKISVDLSPATSEGRKMFLNAYMNVTELDVIDTIPSAPDGGSVQHESVVMLIVPIEDKDQQVTKMHTLSNLLRFSGMNPKLSFTKAPTMKE